MTEQEIRTIVEQVLRQLQQDAPTPAQAAPRPAESQGDPLPDLESIDLRKQ